MDFGLQSFRLMRQPVGFAEQAGSGLAGGGDGFADAVDVFRDVLDSISFRPG